MTQQKKGNITLIALLVLSASGFKICSADSRWLEMPFVGQHLSTEEFQLSKNIDHFEKFYDIYDERSEIITKIRETADYLNATHNYLYAVDMGGRALMIGSTVFLLATWQFAPVCAPVLMSYGVTTAAVGVATSVGANAVDTLISNNPLKFIEKELDQHHDNLREISKHNDRFVDHIGKYRSKLKRTTEKTKQNWIILVKKFAYKWLKSYEEVEKNMDKQLRDLADYLEKDLKQWEKKTLKILHDETK